jgi:hypothetical protein
MAKVGSASACPRNAPQRGFGSSPESWEQYCNTLAASDVAAFGITDYFSFDCFFNCAEHFRRLHSGSPKVFFPNLELRLNETVNQATQLVDIHLILRPDLDRSTAERLLRELKTEIADPSTGRKLSCADLAKRSHFESATVTRPNLLGAIEATFGEESPRTDNVLILTPAGNSGIRASSSQQRKANLADAIDRMADAIFGSEANTEYFLNRDRTEDSSRLAAKPVFSGCDAHTFDQLTQWLGKEVTQSDNRKTVTWIKADPTFDGLLQTLAEPRARVRVQASRPDAKEPYKYISSVRFSGTADFPSEIPLNQNLVSIIGSRSSGKSALLAYIAHAIDPEYAVAQQLAAEPTATSKNIGPAKGKTWASVSHIQCTIEWGETSAKTGRAIYIPQNSLYAISERPEEITAKIQPTLYRLDPDFEAAHLQMGLDVQSANNAIRGAVTEWFRLSAVLESADAALRNLGDKEAIEQTRDSLGKQISKLREASSLTKDESEAYQQLVDELGAIAARLRTIDTDSQRLAPYLTKRPNGAYTANASVGVEIRTLPAIVDLPDGLQPAVADLVRETTQNVGTFVQTALVEYQLAINSEAKKLREQDATLRNDNAELIAKNRANGEIETLVTSRKKQDEALAEIDAKAKSIVQLTADRTGEVERIGKALAERSAAIDRLAGVFTSKPRVLEPMTFGFEQQLSPMLHEQLSERVNRKETGPFVDRDSSLLNIEACQTDPASFLEAILSRRQKIRSGQVADEFSADVLTATPDVRFYAEIESDRVGGFSPSSMTLASRRCSL